MRSATTTALFLLCASAIAHGQILQDFHFNEPIDPETELGAPLSQTQNSIPGGGSWNNDIGGTHTTGDGALRIRRPSGTEQHSYLPLSETVSSGLYRYIVDIRSYNLVGTPSEIFRWSVIQQIPPTSSVVEILSEARFQRASDPEDPAGRMELSGISFLTADGGTPIDPAPILQGGTQDDPVALMLELDMNNRNYEILYKIGATSTSGDPWVSFGQANLSTRDINYIRLTATNVFSTDETEFFDVDRVYFMHAFYGDANRDGMVNIADLSLLASNWQLGVDDGNTATWADGDFNRDGMVNIADLSLLASNWQAGVPAGSPTMSFAEALAMFDVFNGIVIPEPGTTALAALGLLAMLHRRRNI